MAENNFWNGSEDKYIVCQCEPKSGKMLGSVDYCPATCFAPSLAPPRDITQSDSDPATPHQYRLSSNYPNPFNPVTTIKYEVPSPGGFVRLTVYNVRGQVVRNLVSGAIAPGVHKITWNGMNDYGKPVASGMYFFRMTASGYALTRKAVLLK
jgi:hypothetical protein